MNIIEKMTRKWIFNSNTFKFHDIVWIFMLINFFFSAPEAKKEICLHKDCKLLFNRKSLTKRRNLQRKKRMAKRTARKKVAS